MFKKTTNYLKKTAKSVLSSGRLKTLALMLLVGGGIAMAQNSAGDYTADTTLSPSTSLYCICRVPPVGLALLSPSL